MKLRSSMAAKYAGAAMVMCLMPVVPVVADAQTTYEQQQSVKQEGTNILQVSYVEKMPDLVAASNNENDIVMTSEAVALTDSYIEVKASADEDAETVGRLYDYALVYADQIEKGWTKITSGNVSGYVQNEALCFGDEAQILIDEEEDALTVGYTEEEAIEKEEREEQERIAAEEARIKAEQEAAEAERRAQAIREVSVSYGSSVDVSDEELWLLACIVDWEAGGESYQGKLAVANVVLNRLKSGKWGNSLTSVIYAPKQFSGVSDGNGGTSAAFAKRLAKGPGSACLEAATEALSGVNNIGGYTFFRSVSIANYSAYSSYTIIGSHVFY